MIYYLFFIFGGILISLAVLIFGCFSKLEFDENIEEYKDSYPSSYVTTFCTETSLKKHKEYKDSYIIPSLSYFTYNKTYLKKHFNRKLFPRYRKYLK